MATIKMGKRGTVVLPIELRKQFGLEDGSLLQIEPKSGGILIRPAFLYEPEIWTDKTKAYFILINSVTKDEWDQNLPDVIAMGIDPTKIEGLDPNHRDTLPTEAEWNAIMRPARESLSA